MPASPRQPDRWYVDDYRRCGRYARKGTAMGILDQNTTHVSAPDRAQAQRGRRGGQVEGVRVRLLARLAELGEYLHAQQPWGSLLFSPTFSPLASRGIVLGIPVRPLDALSANNTVAETWGVIMSTVV